MAGSAELKGITRFSPRLRILNWLSRIENPITRYVCRYLVRNRTARRAGLWYEILTGIFGPLLFCWIYLVSSHFIRPPSSYRGHGWPLAIAVIDQVYIDIISRAFIVIVVGISITGFLILLLPGVVIVRLEKEENFLKVISIKPSRIFWSVSYVHFIRNTSAI